MDDGRPRMVTIGGGTGSFVVLSGLKSYVRNLTAIVAMSDDGGSTGILRDELGVLPPGDVRQCLVALSRWPRLRELFNYRFEEGSLSGHSFGNLLLTAMEKVTGSFEAAVHEAAQLLSVQGTVLPVTTHDVRLVTTTSSGERIRGESRLEGMPLERGSFTVALEPECDLNPRAAQKIMAADVVVICPGDLYTSVIPHFLVRGMGETVRRSKAKKVVITGLMNKEHTKGFQVHDYVREIERYAGGPLTDFVLYNTAKPPKHALERYAEEGELLTADEEIMAREPYTAIGGNFLSRRLATQQKSDMLKRSLIRHDPDRIARAIMQVYWR